MPNGHPRRLEVAVFSLPPSRNVAVSWSVIPHSSSVPHVEGRGRVTPRSGVKPDTSVRWDRRPTRERETERRPFAQGPASNLGRCRTGVDQRHVLTVGVPIVIAGCIGEHADADRALLRILLPPRYGEARSVFVRSQRTDGARKADGGVGGVGGSSQLRCRDSLAAESSASLI